MDLKPREIPVAFLEALPEGIKLVTRHGHPYLVMETFVDAEGNDLMDSAVRIHHEPTVRIRVKAGESEGFVFLDAYWGSHAKLFSFVPDLSRGDVVEASSPVGGGSLMEDWECPEPGCGSRRGIRLRLPGGRNAVTVCGRLGCPGHHIDISSVPPGVSDTLSNINFFGEGLEIGDDEPFAAF